MMIYSVLFVFYPYLNLSLRFYSWVVQHNKFSSQVNSRVDTVAVGKLSLNLTCFNKESVSVFGTKLSLAIKNLLPITQCIALTIDYLNTASLAPRKDYETNRLVYFKFCGQETNLHLICSFYFTI